MIDDLIDFQLPSLSFKVAIAGSSHAGGRTAMFCPLTCSPAGPSFTQPQLHASTFSRRSNCRVAGQTLRLKSLGHQSPHIMYVSMHVSVHRAVHCPTARPSARPSAGLCPPLPFRICLPTRPHAHTSTRPPALCQSHTMQCWRSEFTHLLARCTARTHTNQVAAKKKRNRNGQKERGGHRRAAAAAAAADTSACMCVHARARAHTIMRQVRFHLTLNSEAGACARACVCMRARARVPR